MEWTIKHHAVGAGLWKKNRRTTNRTLDLHAVRPEHKPLLHHVSQRRFYIDVKNAQSLSLSYKNQCNNFKNCIEDLTHIRSWLLYCWSTHARCQRLGPMLCKVVRKAVISLIHSHWFPNLVQVQTAGATETSVSVATRRPGWRCCQVCPCEWTEVVGSA